MSHGRPVDKFVGAIQAYNEKAKGNKSTRVYCPACRQAFQGENADQDYKDHWKDEHKGKVRE